MPPTTLLASGAVASPRRARSPDPGYTVAYLTRRKGAHAGVLRFPAGSEATTQKCSCRLRSFAGTSQRTVTLRVPILKADGEARVARSEWSS